LNQALARWAAGEWEAEVEDEAVYNLFWLDPFPEFPGLY
jgi:hypothetical protein